MFVATVYINLMEKNVFVGVIIMLGDRRVIHFFVIYMYFKFYVKKPVTIIHFKIAKSNNHCTSSNFSVIKS